MPLPTGEGDYFKHDDLFRMGGGLLYTTLLDSMCIRAAGDWTDHGLNGILYRFLDLKLRTFFFGDRDTR